MQTITTTILDTDKLTILAAIERCRPENHEWYDYSVSGGKIKPYLVLTVHYEEVPMWAAVCNRAEHHAFVAPVSEYEELFAPRGLTQLGYFGNEAEARQRCDTYLAEVSS